MIVEYIRYRIPISSQQEFVEDYRQAVESLGQSVYCLGYELTQCEEDIERFILRIEWTSTDEHMNKFRTSSEFKSFIQHIRPYIDNIDEMQHYKATGISSNSQG